MHQNSQKYCTLHFHKKHAYIRKARNISHSIEHKPYDNVTHGMEGCVMTPFASLFYAKYKILFIPTNYENCLAKQCPLTT
jgi:hypothetical protein